MKSEKYVIERAGPFTRIVCLSKGQGSLDAGFAASQH